MIEFDKSVHTILLIKEEDDLLPNCEFDTPESYSFEFTYYSDNEELLDNIYSKKLPIMYQTAKGDNVAYQGVEGQNFPQLFYISKQVKDKKVVIRVPQDDEQALLANQSLPLISELLSIL